MAPFIHNHHHHLVLVLFLSIACAAAVGPTGLRFHHRFSPAVRRWAESLGRELPGGWPEPGCADHLAALSGHDLHRRALVGANEEVTFAEGNATIKFSSLGFLHYALVTVGTPGESFMVALDTGSDLFWLPCECTSYSPPTSASSGIDFEANFYSPNLSLTSQRVPCESNFCNFQDQCSAKSQCTYKVTYVSVDTSSSGFLVEDVLYLTTEDAHPETVEAQIVFGCGQVQTGSFLEAAAPTGLLGLGMDKMSIPSILSSTGLTSNSFSMCFGLDGIGRISFGDQGSSDQEETPLQTYQIHPTYDVTITGISVGQSAMDIEFNSLFDTGTSFTYLADPAYTYLTQNFHSHIQENRRDPDSRIPFEYCYNLRPNFNKIQTPDVSLTMDGGSFFPVNDPGQVISIQQNEYVYCLAIVKSSKLNIIGQNFMTGLRVVFDRERKVLGWKKFNCYDVENSNLLPVNPRNSSGHSPSEGYSPQDTKDGRNGTEVTELTPLSFSSRLNPFTSLVFILFLVPMTFL